MSISSNVHLGHLIAGFPEAILGPEEGKDQLLGELADHRDVLVPPEGDRLIIDPIYSGDGDEEDHQIEQNCGEFDDHIDDDDDQMMMVMSLLKMMMIICVCLASILRSAGTLDGRRAGIQTWGGCPRTWTTKLFTLYTS